MDKLRQLIGSPPPPPPPPPPAAATTPIDPQVMDKLKSAAVSQASNQSLGTYKIIETDSTKYGNFLIPIIPREP